VGKIFDALNVDLAGHGRGDDSLGGRVKALLLVREHQHKLAAKSKGRDCSRLALEWIVELWSSWLLVFVLLLLLLLERLLVIIIAGWIDGNLLLLLLGLLVLLLLRLLLITRGVVVHFALLVIVHRLGKKKKNELALFVQFLTIIKKRACVELAS